VEREARPVEGGDLAERHGKLFVEADGQRNRVRPELYRRRAKRIRGLERMAPLHAPMAGVALAHVDVKAPHDRRDRGQIFLILGGNVGLAHRTPTARTRRRHRYVVRLMHDRRDRALPAAAVHAARLPPGAARPPFRRALRKWRRLARSGAARGLQFVLQACDFALQPRPLPLETRAFLFGPGPLGLRTLKFPPQPLILSPQFVDGFGSLLFGAPAHAPVMPEFGPQYKSAAVTKYPCSWCRCP
jgi:hypothetical protein